MKKLVAASILTIVLASCSLRQSNQAGIVDSVSVWGEYNKIAQELGFQRDSSYLKAEDELNEARLTGDSEELHDAYNSLGYIMYRARRWDRAIRYYYQAADYARLSGNQEGEAYAYWNMGKAFYEAYAFDQAIQSYQKAIRICKQIEKYSWEGRISYAMGSAYFKAKRYSEADTVLQHALEIFQELNDQERMGYVYIALGNIAYESETYPEAIKQYHTAEKLVNSLYLKGWIMVNTGLAYKSMDRTIEAERFYKTAYELMEEVSAPDLLISLNQQYGDLMMRRAPEEGVQILLQNIDLIDSVGYSEPAAVTLRALVAYYEKNEKYTEANKYLHQLDKIQAPFAERKEELEQLNMQLEVVMANNELQQNSRMLASAEMKWLLAGLSITVLILAGTLAYSDRKRRFYLEQLLTRSTRQQKEQEEKMVV